MEYKLSFIELRVVNPVKRFFMRHGGSVLKSTGDHIFMLMAVFYLLAMGSIVGFAVFVVLAFYFKLAEIREELRPSITSVVNVLDYDFKEKS